MGSKVRRGGTHTLVSETLKFDVSLSEELEITKLSRVGGTTSESTLLSDMGGVDRFLLTRSRVPCLF